MRHPTMLLRSFAICLALAAAACTGPDDPAPTAPKCDPAKCAPRNTCVQERCMLQCERHVDCPKNQDCGTIDGIKVCVANGFDYKVGRFGQICGANGDEDCDTAHGYLCIGPIADPDSYCTLGGCTRDDDCPGNYYCGSVERTGETGTKIVKACLKRAYCAPASGLIDCNDSDAAFALDSNQKGFCSRKCNTADPATCGSGNVCDESGLCRPRDGTCWPEPAFCSRCQTSADCPSGGACYTSDFSKERFCITSCSASNPTCPKSAGGVEGACYKRPDSTTLGWCMPKRTGEPQSCWPEF